MSFGTIGPRILRKTGTVVSRRRWTVVDPFIASEIDLTAPALFIEKKASPHPGAATDHATSHGSRDQDRRWWRPQSGSVDDLGGFAGPSAYPTRAWRDERARRPSASDCDSGVSYIG